MISLYSWNINGIRSAIKSGKFTEFIDKHQPDIIGLQETRAEQGQAEIDLPQYSEYWYGANRKGYSGTAVFSKPQPQQITLGLPTHILKDNQAFNDKYGDTLNEGRIITAKYKNFYFVTVYTPNSKRDLSRLDFRHKIWDPEFLKYLKHLEEELPVVVCGDFNVAHTEDDLANPKNNIKNAGFTPQEREGFQNIIESGFIDTFRVFQPNGNGYYTWWAAFANARARNIGWRIDYFLISPSLKKLLKKAEIHPSVFGSDHCPVSIELNFRDA